MSENRDGIFRDEVVMHMVRMACEAKYVDEDEAEALNCAVRGAIDIQKLKQLMDDDPVLLKGYAEYYPDESYDD